MADLTITTTDVRAQNDSKLKFFTAGETIDIGEDFYVASGDQKAYKADNTTAAKASAKGIALTKAVADETLTGVTGGSIGLGVVLTVGEAYGISDNAGKIRPISDNATGDIVTLFGFASSTSVLEINIWQTGITHS